MDETTPQIYTLCGRGNRSSLRTLRRGTTYIHSFIRTYIHKYTHNYTHTRIHLYILYIHTYTHAFIHTYKRTSFSVYIHTYIQTHIYVIHTYIRALKRNIFCVQVYPSRKWLFQSYQVDPLPYGQSKSRRWVRYIYIDVYMNIMYLSMYACMCRVTISIDTSSCPSTTQLSYCQSEKL